MTFNTLPKFAGKFFNWLSRISCGSLVMLAFAAPLQAVDMLYVTLYNHSIESYDTSGNIGATIAASVATFANTGMYYPNGLAFDSSSNLYVANILGNYITKFNSSGEKVSYISSNLSAPIGLAFDTSVNLYATNPSGSHSNTISKFNSSGEYVSNISSNLTSPTGLAFDTSGNLYAANANNGL
ncbi:MAG: hypothetical protein WCJ40_21740 [Planctomycetota bacterium]